ncbi:MAG: peptidase M16 [Clostridiaceae bacterium]|nr:peptidase M16 [Clostridiaceae bacterium]
MKKIISLTLAIVLLMSMGVQLNAANTEEIQLHQLPEVGQVISGFRAEEIGYMEIVNAKTVLFEHEKTGAKLFYIQSKDIDRSFEVAFRTPAVDNTGANHILEHITISGSKNYPMKNVLFTILNQTYSTFINAFTSPTVTSYPVSSMSEEQLLKLAEVYLDCVYHPSVYTDRNIFLREAWRYEMTDTDAPLLINGTVYNEMKGAMGDISTAALYNVLDALFPNSFQANNSGGDPEKIIDLTYEQLVQTHQNYYHPSNSLMILYGDLDYSKFLEMIDEQYLQSFDRKDIQINYGKIAPLQHKTEHTYKFPVTADTNTENMVQIDYAFALTDVTEEDLVGLTILVSVLNQDSSPLQQAFREKQIGGRMSVSLVDSFVQPVLIFKAENADIGKKDAFQALVDDGIRSVSTNGCDKNVVDATLSSIKLSNSNLTEMTNLGINLSLATGVIWANTGSVNYYNNLIQNLNSITNKIGDRYLEDLNTKYIQNNNHAALVLTVPEPGLTEQLAEQHQVYLAELKASMSLEEIEKIVSDTQAYNEWNSRETDPAIVNQLQVVQAADLPVEVKAYKINETELEDGVRMLSTAADVAETGFTALLLDTSAVPIEKLHWLQLYSGLLGKMDTERYTKEQLGTLAIRYLNSASFNLSTIPQDDWNTFTPVVNISWMGLMEEYADQMELVTEILLHTQFTDVDTIINHVKQQSSSLKNMFINNPVNLLIVRNMANQNACSNYQNYVSGMDYYSFLTQVEQALQTSPDAVLTELESLHQLVLNKTNMITMFTGNESNIGKYEEEVGKLLDTLPAKAIVAQDYTQIPAPARKEGITINTAVQYNMISADYESMGTTYSGKFIPIALVISENYITPRIRFGYGAYDNIVNFSSTSFMMISYRDPNIRETLEVYKGLPEFIRTLDITQEELDRYILKAFSTFTQPEGEITGAVNTMNNYLMGKTVEDRLKILEEIKSTTVSDLRDSAAMFEALLANGIWSTVGSAEKIEANLDLYETVMAFGQEPSEPVTRAQFFELILSGVPEPVEVAKQMGLLLGDGEGNYHEDEKLTMEQLAVIINRLADMNGMKLTGEAVAISDEADISPWALESVQNLVSSGVSKLDADGNYNPKGEVTESIIQSIMNELMMKLTGA